MEGGTEAFPDLGLHCELPDCRQLDFLPFSCDRCHKVFCLEHRTYKSHECPVPDQQNSRKMVVCDICSTAIETTGKFGEDEKAILEKHLKSRDCDASKKHKPRCPVPRCKANLTFSNNVVCRCCNIQFCLKHRFPADHACKARNASAKGELWNKFGAFSLKNCAKDSRQPGSRTSSLRSIQVN